MKASSGRLPGDGSAQARRQGVGLWVHLPQISFVPSLIFCAQKNDKNKNISAQKMYFSPQTLKSGYGPGCA